MQLVSRSESNPEEKLPPKNRGSEARFSDEVKYEIEVKIEAERSIDSHEKEFRFQRDTFINEYLNFVDSVYNLKIIENQNTMEIMNKLSNMTIDQINFISQNLVLNLIEEVIIRVNDKIMKSEKSKEFLIEDFYPKHHPTIELQPFYLKANISN